MNKLEKVTKRVENEIQVSMSYYGFMAGLTFAASIFAFQFRADFPYGNIFLTLTLATTVFFCVSATAAGQASGKPDRDIEGDFALHMLNVADRLGAMGFFLLLADINFIAFAIGWIYGFILLIVTVATLCYFFRYL